MRVVIHKNGMLEMSIINVIFLTNVEKCFRVLITSLLPYVTHIELGICLVIEAKK